MLTPEILDHAARELAAYAKWFEMRHWIQLLYGPEAATITLSYRGESDDEGGTDYHITWFWVKDAQGEELAPRFEDEVVRSIEIVSNSLNRIATLGELEEHYRKKRLLFINDIGSELLPVDEDVNVYDFTNPPRLTYSITINNEAIDHA